MRVDPIRLANHLARLRVPGVVTDATLQGRFEAVVEVPDQRLLVSIPPLQDSDVLPEPMGVDVEVFEGALRLLRGKQPDQPNQRPELTLDSRVNLRGPTFSFQLLRLDPRLDFLPESKAVDSAFRIEHGQELLAWSALTRKLIPFEGVDLADNLERWLRAFKGEIIELHVGPDGGSFAWRSCALNLDLPVVSVVLSHGLTAETNYTLTFEADTFVGLVRAMNGPGSPEQAPRVFLHGPRRAVGFQTADNYRYLIGPKDMIPLKT